MKYRINWEGGVFAVPDIAAEGLRLADENAARVLLYIMKFKTQNGICEYLGINEEQMENALSYWQSVGVLYDSREAPPEAAAAVDKVPAKNKKEPLPKPSKLMSAGEMAEKINGNSEIRTLLDSVQTTLGRDLTFDDRNTIIWMYEHLGLKPEVILMLVGYCAGIGRGNMHYIQKMAATWADEGIDSPAAADSKILVLQKNNSFYVKCAKRMNLDRGLTEREKTYAAKWCTAGADIELVMNAFERTVSATGKVSFPYMNKIIVKWLENGIKTSLEADEFSAATAPAKQNSSPKAPVKSENSSFDEALSDIIERSKTTPIIP